MRDSRIFALKTLVPSFLLPYKLTRKSFGTSWLYRLPECLLKEEGVSLGPDIDHPPAPLVDWIAHYFQTYHFHLANLDKPVNLLLNLLGPGGGERQAQIFRILAS